MKNKCPIAISAYNRPEYLDQCLRGWSMTEEIQLQEIPFFVFCDGGKESKQEENIKIIKKYSFVSDVICQSKNMGIPMHRDIIHNTVFNLFNYDRSIIMEEDVIPSPYYYRYVNHCMNFCGTVDNKIGMVNSFILSKLTLEQKLNEHWKYIGDYHGSLCNYLMLKTTWNKISPIYNEYITRFIIPHELYHNRPHNEIIEWTTGLKNSSSYYNGIFKSSSSQDGIMSIAMRSLGMCYMSSRVNRVLYIGKIGVHCSDAWFYKHGFDRENLDTIPQDEFSTEFIIKNL